MISGPFCLCGFYIILIFDDTMKISVFTLGHPQLTSRKQFGIFENQEESGPGLSDCSLVFVVVLRKGLT